MISVDLQQVLSIAGALLLGTLAALYGIAWRSRRQQWSGAFALAYLLAALVFAFDRFTRPQGGQPSTMAVWLTAPALVLLVEGMMDSAGIRGRSARIVRVASTGGGCLIVLLNAAGALTQLNGFALVSVYLGAIALMAVWAAANEPSSGHGLVFLALMSFLVTVGAATFDMLPVSLLRYVIIVPLTIVGMTQLATGLVREQRRADAELCRARRAEEALRAANVLLEQRIEQALQTADVTLANLNEAIEHSDFARLE